MKDESVSHWFDVIAPRPPKAGWFDSLEPLVLLGAVTVVVLILLRGNATAKAIFLLIKLEISQRWSLAASRQHADEMGYLLSLALRVPQLRKCLLFTRRHEQWLNFVYRLEQAKFAENPPTDSEITALLQQTRMWLFQSIRIKLKSKFRSRKPAL